MHVPSSLTRGLALILVVAAGCGGSGAKSTTSSSSSSSGSGGASSGSGGAGGSGGGADPSLVQTDKGPVQGTVTGGTRAFYAIPYAAPPVGPLRWKPPQPAASWSFRDGTARGPFCPQLAELSTTPMPGTSEDCLTVNVWAPSPAPAKPAPVMVWIHGGGFVSGSGADPTYDGTLLSAATGAVVVTMNYRLGALGFLAHSALESEDPMHPSSGMYGFEDQRAALAWAKTNAAAFGGDPTNVTLFGESAGGISTCLHLLAPKSASLFDRVIIESGPCALAGSTEKAAEPQGDAFAAALGCNDPSTVLTCMRAASPSQVLTALPQKTADIGPTGASWLPVVDGFNIPDQPDALLTAGTFTKVPTLLGSNGNEGTLFFSIGLSASTDADYLALMNGMFQNQGPAIVAQYPSAMYGGSDQAAAEAAIGDGLFVCPTRFTARALAQGGSPTFLYHFVHAPMAIFAGLGAFHSSEVPFIWENPYLGIVLDPAEKALSKTMIGYWFGLAKAGDPNGSGAPMWPHYAMASDQDQLLDLTISTQTALDSATCDFWDGLGL